MYKLISLALLTLILTILLIEIQPETNQLLINQSPVIGIFTQPSKIIHYPSANYTYIAASYVKFLESSGARVVYIPYEADYSTLDTIFENINGILLPGGSSLLTGPSIYSKQVNYLFQKAVQANLNGDYFPIYGICLGHELIHYILSDFDSKFRVSIKGDISITRPLDNLLAKESSIYSTLNNHLLESITTQNICKSKCIFLAYYHHSYAIVPDLYDNHVQVRETLQIVATNMDSQGIEFIAATEGYSLPILTTQYHPEKNPFEWTVNANHNKDAVSISQAHGNAFVRMARKSTHQFNLGDYLMDNFNAIVPDDSTYTQVYIFIRLNSFEEEIDEQY